MALLSSSSDYTDRDFEAIRRRLRGLVLSTFPNWTADQVANFGNLLVELYAYVGDMLSFYQDAQAAEAHITTATQRKNLLALAKLLNYTPAGATAATAPITFTLAAPVPSGRTVTFNPPATPTPTNPTIIRTQDAESPAEFQLLAPVVITAGNTTGAGTVENSQVQVPEVFTSTGLANQAYRLSRSPYLPGTAAPTASDGAYTKVSNFLQSTSTDRHFVETSDDQDRVAISFGNGTNGKIPVGSITVPYKTGGGVAGNVIAGSIVAVEGSFVDSAGFPVTVTATNAVEASGGRDRQSNESIRESAPASMSTPVNTVARTDFEVNALRVSGVERALMQTRNEDATISENAGKLYVVPTGLGFPTTTLKNTVLTQFVTNYPQVLTFATTVVDPIYLDIGLAATLFLKPGYKAAAVRANILAAVRDFFAPTLTQNLIDVLGLDENAGARNPLVDFGYNLKAVSGSPAGEIALSDLFEVVAAVDGIRGIGDDTNDFRLKAYRVITATTHYTGGDVNAVLVQALNHLDVPIAHNEWPRLKKTTIGGAILDIDLTIDGTNFPPA